MASALTGARWSAAARCPRQAAYDILGAFREALPSRTQGLYDRGHDVEDAWFRRNGQEAVRQYPVEWGKGWEAHVDGVWVDDPKRPHVEVKSTVNIDSLPGSPVTWDGVKTTSAVLQIVGGTHFDPQGGTAEIVAVSPVDYSEHVYPIRMTEDLVGLADETAARVVRSAETGELPERCCSRPMEGYSRFCAYVNTCFDGWTEPDPIQLGGEVASLARELRAAEETCKEAGVGAKGATHARDALRAAIREHLPGPGDYTVGGVHIRLGAVKGRESFRLKDAIAAGLLTADDAEPFTKHGDPSERWAVSTEDDPC
jgi:hypothetical protein